MKVDITTMVKYFRDFSTNHQLIREFGFGPIDQIQVQDRDYPLMWLSLKPSSMGTNDTTLNFDVYLLTNQNQDHTNLENSMNDMYYLGRDLVSGFYNIEDFDVYNGSNSLRFTPIMLDFDDVVGGWVFNVPVEFQSDYCYNENDYDYDPKKKVKK